MANYIEVERPGELEPNAIYRAEGLADACRRLAKRLAAEPAARVRVISIVKRKGPHRGAVDEIVPWAWREDGGIFA